MAERRRDLAVVAVLLALAIPALSYGHANTAATTIIVSGLAASTLLVWRTRQDVILGTTGLVVGPLVELAATACGLWTYSSPSVAGLPLWVLPMWWIYPQAVTRVVAAMAGRGPIPASMRFSVGLIFIVVSLLCALGMVWPTVAFVGTLILLGTFLRRHHTPVDVITLVVCGVIGPGAEWLPVSMGAWRYPDGPLFGLPVWLPTGYGVFGAALIHLALALAVRARRSQSHSPPRAPRNSPAPQPS
jgi:uncharacterized membrane protein YoaT (DUF817 family)